MQSRNTNNVKGIYLLVDEYDAFSNEYLDLNDGSTWNESQSLLKGFWAQAKACMTTNEISRCFITGVSPLLMADFTVVSISSPICAQGPVGTNDVWIRGNQGQRHFKIMKKQFGNYRFFQYGDVLSVFNTNTCLKYLQCIHEREIPPDHPSNSESFKLDKDITRSRSAWLSFVLHVGTVLDHYKLNVDDVVKALQQVVSTGDILVLLGYYRHLVSEHDVGDDDLTSKSEENH
ncbi:5549_t:CDS:2 [Entrophospora sp. SA101]|nr:5549_t:CDS:2 [Entrophospora sp. SA101]